MLGTRVLGRVVSEVDPVGRSLHRAKGICHDRRTASPGQGLLSGGPDRRPQRAGTTIASHCDEPDVALVSSARPSNSELLCLKGELLVANGKPVEAASAFSAALAVDPGCARAWALRGALAHRAGDLAAAIGDLERARTLSEAPGIRFDLAVVYHAITRHDLAVELLDAILGEVEDPDVRLQRASCLLDLGRAEDARVDLLVCLAAGPKYLPRVHELMPELNHA
jgi:tetratricopeptide (TPR) repeat protein